MTSGDYDIRALEIEQIFALNPLPDNCIDAANLAAQKFPLRFPGWQIYCRIVRGESVFDRQITAWAIGAARIYSRMRKTNGRQVVGHASRGPWIAQAAVDAVESVILGKSARSAATSSLQHGVDDEMYARFRNELAGLILLGFQGYAAELHCQFYRVRALSLLAA